MSQAAVEKALGKLVTDEAFRDRFFTDPAVASFNAGLELSGTELDALSRLPEKALTQFSRWLDDRIRRLPLDSDRSLASADGLDTEAGRPPDVCRMVIGSARPARKRGVG